ncbi:MAG: ABC transporter ATP-binding protein [Agarilytica sp.]
MITLKNVCKTYQVGDSPLRALDHVDLEIKPGDYLSVMGPSGSGKSTLLNAIGLLDRPDSGSLYIDNENTVNLSEEKRANLRQKKIGFIFQSFHLIPRLSASENIEVPLMLSQMSVKERKQRVHNMLENLGLADRADHLPKQLSGGQLQRVAIARALVTEPQILLADEPTGNLDSHSGKDVVQLLEKFNSDGITLLVVTHDLQLGSRAPRKLQIIDGKIQEVDEHHAFT